LLQRDVKQSELIGWKTWFESQLLQHSHGKSVFLAHFSLENKLLIEFSHSLKLTLVLLKADFPARQL
jgi:hypothetical protein